jgi:hypothetical protein
MKALGDETALAIALMQLTAWESLDAGHRAAT